MKVLLTRRLPSAVVSRLHAAAELTLYEGPVPISPEEMKRLLPGMHGLISVTFDPLPADVIDAGRDLKVIANIAAGYENIDVAAAKARGIVVTNTPDVVTESTAELTWGLILTLTRRIAEGDRLVRRGAWKGWAMDFMLGMSLQDKQLGIIGAGRIGRSVARRAPAFGMRAVFAARGPGEPGPTLSLDELLVSSDVVSIHAPATPETKHLINRRTLARMKRTAFLISVGRGSIVDEEALAWAMKEHLIAGAAMDVYEREPLVHPDLMTMENVVMAPHLGSATREVRIAMSDLAVSNALAVLEGRSPLTPV